MAYTDIDTDDLFSHMFGAARDEAKDSWSSVKGILKIELKSLAREIKEIGKGVALNEISEMEGQLLLRLVRQNVASVAASTTSLTLPKAEIIVASALESISASVNGALGFSLI